jgi:hypothetical protein
VVAVAPYVELARVGGGRISVSMTGEVVARGRDRQQLAAR